MRKRRGSKTSAIHASEKIESSKTTQQGRKTETEFFTLFPSLPEKKSARRFSEIFEAGRRRRGGCQEITFFCQAPLFNKTGGDFTRFFHLDTTRKGLQMVVVLVSRYSLCA